MVPFCTGASIARSITVMAGVTVVFTPFTIGVHVAGVPASVPPAPASHELP